MCKSHAPEDVLVSAIQRSPILHDHVRHDLEERLIFAQSNACTSTDAIAARQVWSGPAAGARLLIHKVVVQAICPAVDGWYSSIDRRRLLPVVAWRRS